MSGRVVVATLGKNSRETVRVALDTYRGAQLLDVRVCVELVSGTGILTPTAKGVSVRIERLPELLDALTAARERARELGWLGEEGAPDG